MFLLSHRYGVLVSLFLFVFSIKTFSKTEFSLPTIQTSSISQNSLILLNAIQNIKVEFGNDRLEVHECLIAYVSKNTALVNADCFLSVNGLLPTRLTIGSGDQTRISKKFNLAIHPLYTLDPNLKGKNEALLTYSQAILEFLEEPEYINPDKNSKNTVQSVVELSNQTLEFNSLTQLPELKFITYENETQAFSQIDAAFGHAELSKDFESSNYLKLKSLGFFRTQGETTFSSGVLFHQDQLVGLMNYQYLQMDTPNGARKIYGNYSTSIRSQESQKFLLQNFIQNTPLPIEKVCVCKEKLYNKYSFLGFDGAAFDEKVLERIRLELVFSKSSPHSNQECSDFEKDSIPIHFYKNDPDFDENGERVLTIDGCTEVPLSEVKKINFAPIAPKQENIVAQKISTLKQFQDTAYTYLRTLQANHVLKPSDAFLISKEQSRIVFFIWIQNLDPKREFFQQADIDEFSQKYEDHILALIQSRDLQFALDIEKRLYERAKERSLKQGDPLPQEVPLSEIVEPLLSSVGLAFDPHSTYLGPETTVKRAKTYGSAPPNILTYADSKTAIFKFPVVSTGIAKEIETLYKNLEVEPESIVLDLRGNRGGRVDEAHAILSLFIKTGPLSQHKNALGNVSIEYDRNPQILTQKPLFVWVDYGTASSAEMIAAALQDYKRALVIGSQTFGKGTMQTSFPTLVNPMKPGDHSPDFFGSLNPIGGANITSGILYRINGKSVQSQGVTPDLLIPLEKTPRKESDYANAIKPGTVPGLDYESAEIPLFESIPTLQASFEEFKKTKPVTEDELVLGFIKSLFP